MLKGKNTIYNLLLLMAVAVTTLTAIVSCARMGSPDGGWYDERPPYVVAAMPEENSTDVKSQKVVISFNEFIKIDNIQEKVVISPPQLEQAEIKAHSKAIKVTLKDSLKPNTTYTIDFSDAISDNNENNPMGMYTYTFSTGSQIDTMQVSGVLLNAETLEPVKGLLVGLMHADSLSNSTFLRVSRSDSRGRFTIKGVAPGTYHIGAVNDMDGNYRFSQKGETMAFTHQMVTPGVFLDTRQDTIWADSVHIKDIIPVKYWHYTPDNIILRTFNHIQTMRSLLKTERVIPECFSLYFTAPLLLDTLQKYPVDGCSFDTIQSLGYKYVLPQLRLLEKPATATVPTENIHDWLVVEPSQHGDTISYWLRDTAFVNQDTLRIELTTLVTDTAGMSVMTDTLEILSKTPLAKRLKEKKQAEEEWQKKLEKRRKKLKEGEELTDTIMPVKHLKPKINVNQSMDPDGAVFITFEKPMKLVQKDSVHLYVEQDSLWYRAPFTLQQTDSLDSQRSWELYSEWIPGAEYSLEIDSLAFEDIYGMQSTKYKQGLKVKQLDEYASLFVNVTYTPTDSTAWNDKSQIIVYLLDASEKAVRKVVVRDKSEKPSMTGTAEFYYVNPATFYLKAVVDRNGNGQWDTGDFYLDQQPEEVYYCTEEVECKAKWDLTREWNLTAKPLNQQKPAKLVKQKAEKERTIQNRNAQRAQEKGVEIPEKWRRYEGY